MHDPFRIESLHLHQFQRRAPQRVHALARAAGQWRLAGRPGGLLRQHRQGGRSHAALCARLPKHWQVPIHWLEYRPTEPGFAVVDFDTASREGEPFEALIRKRQYLPNPVARGCTSALKIRTMHRFLRRQGWTDWDQFIGIRADEQRRVAKIRARGHSTESRHETMCMPLADAGVTVHDVSAFWQAQPFDLELLTVNGRTLEGNCDLCFLKPRGQRLALIKARPEAAVWWIRMESLNLASRPSGARFRNDGPSYADLARFAADQGDLFDATEEAIACFCGD